MVARWSQIPAKEVHDSRREWFDGDGRFFASVKLQCDWEDRFKLIQDLYTSRYGTADPDNTTGYNPRVYPDPGDDSGAPQPIAAPVMTKIGVTSATLMTWEECGLPRLGSDEVYKYKTSAFVQVQYGRHFSIQESIEFDTEVVTQSYLDFRWKTPAFTGDLGYIKELEVPVSTLYSAILTRDFVGLAPASFGGELIPDISTLIEAVGKVNTKEYESTQLGITFKKGTLLMLEPELRPSIDMQNFDPTNNFGGKGVAVTLKFLHKLGGDKQGDDIDTHNLFWRPVMTYGADPDTFHGDWDRLLTPIPGQNKTDWKEYRPFKDDPNIDLHWLLPGSVPLPVI